MNLCIILYECSGSIVHVSSQCIHFTNTTCDFNNALVNAVINMTRLINAVEVLFLLNFMLTNVIN